MKPSILPLEKIVVGERFRKDYGDLSDLMESLQEVGLIQPVVVTVVSGEVRLVAGGRRCAAAQKLGWTEIPVVLAPEEAQKEIVLRMMELEENVRRKDMNWKERCALVAELHRLHQKDAHLKGERWSRLHTGKLVGLSEGNVQYCVQMSELLADPKHPVQQAESLSDALRILMQQKEDAMKSRLAAMSMGSSVGKGTIHQPQGGSLSVASGVAASIISEVIAASGGSTAVAAATPKAATGDRCTACEGTGKNSKGEVCPICNGQNIAVTEDAIVVPFSQMFYLGDCLTLLDKLPPESIDHVISDPPYAIDMDHLNQNNPNGGMVDIERVRETHDVESNLHLLHAVLPKLFRVMKDKSFCVLFYDNVHWSFLQTIAETAGFKVQRWPLVWAKTSVCQNQCASFNWTKATEFAIVLRKGTATLISQQPHNYWLGQTPDKREFDHPFAKPPALWEWVLRAFAHPGQYVLDPFMGSATSMYAAAKLGLRPLGMELDPVHFNEAIRVMRNAYEVWMAPRKVEFK